MFKLTTENKKTGHSKIEVQRDVRNSKVQKQDKFSFSVNIRTHDSPKAGQDQVSGGVSVICWYTTPLQIFDWSLMQLDKKSNSVIKQYAPIIWSEDIK